MWSKYHTWIHITKINFRHFTVHTDILYSLTSHTSSSIVRFLSLKIHTFLLWLPYFYPYLYLIFALYCTLVCLLPNNRVEHAHKLIFALPLTLYDTLSYRFAIIQFTWQNQGRKVSRKLISEKSPSNYITCVASIARDSSKLL